MKPSLLLDVDNVQRAFTTKAFEIYRRDFDSDSKYSIDDVNVFDLSPFFTKLPYSIIDFISDYAEELFFESDPFEDNISEIVSGLKDFYFIHVVTHQFKGVEHYTFKWLKRFNIDYDAVSFVKDKSLIKGHLLVDDGAHNLDSLMAEGVDVVCINRPWNRSWREAHPNNPSFSSLGEFLSAYDHESIVRKYLSK